MPSLIANYDLRNIALILAAVAAIKGVAVAAAPLAVLETREMLDRDWPRTLLTYELRAGEVSPPDADGHIAVTIAGKALPDTFRLVDAATGADIPYQLSHLTHGKKALRGKTPAESARLSFFAALGRGGTFRYEILPGQPAAAKRALTTVAQGALVLDNGLVALRLPLPETVTYKEPQALEGESAPGPLRGIRLCDGRWVGGSFFQADAPATAPRLTGHTCRITASGPLFAEAEVRYTLDNGGWYQLTARILDGDPALRLDEQFDTGAPGSALNYRLVVTLGAGWRPSTAYYYAPARTESDPAFAALLAARSLTNETPHHSMALSSARGPLFPVAVRYPWHPNAHWFGLVESAAATSQPAAAIPFLGVVPLHAGNWRGAANDSDGMVTAAADGTLRLDWRLRASPHPRTLLHTGECDPALPLTHCRRQWALVGGPFLAPHQLHAMRANEGFVTLDDYKEWLLDWPENPATTYPRLVFNKADIARLKPLLETLPGAETMRNFLYFNDNEARLAELWQQLSSDFEWSSPYGQARYVLSRGDPPEMPWAAHYRQSQMAGWAGAADELLSSGLLTPERRARLRRDLAALCYTLTEPDINPRGTMTHLGNPNMPINRFMALTFAAALIPDHPMAPRWLDVSTRYLKYKLAMNTAPGGTWSELITYFGASAPHIMQAAAVLATSGRGDAAEARLSAMPALFTLSLLTPPDPRFGGARELPNWGHEGADTLTHWLVAAANIRPTDTALARDFAWAWDRQGRPMNQHHDAGFSERVLSHTDLLAGLPANYTPTALGSTWLPGFGAILRAHAGTPGETYFSFRQGYLFSHCDPNQGDFVLYAKGAPLVTLSLHAYPLHQVPSIIELDKTFGWHNRVRFGSPGNGGGWPGGGAVGGVPWHSFSASLDYLRAIGDYPPQTWTRQIAFLKSRAASGTSYIVLRDSFTPSAGFDQAALERKWWALRTPGGKGQVTPAPGGLLYKSAFGPRLDVRLLQPAATAMESREVAYEMPLYFGTARAWARAGGTITAGKAGDDSISAPEAMTVNSFGPVTAGDNIMATLVPLAADEPAPRIEALGDGALRVAADASTDYIFLGESVNYEGDGVRFEGRAGAVRLFPDEVHLIISDGPGTISYRGTILRSAIPTLRVIPIAQLATPQTFAVAMPPSDLADSALPEGFSLSGDARCVLTVGDDTISGRSDGRGGFLYAPMPPDLKVLPMLLLDGQTYAPGTSGGRLIIPLMPGKHEFEVRALEQPPIFRNWQAW